MCDFEWLGPFWGGEPGVDEQHVCIAGEEHDGPHRCRCGETADREIGDQS